MIQWTAAIDFLLSGVCVDVLLGPFRWSPVLLPLMDQTKPPTILPSHQESAKGGTKTTRFIFLFFLLFFARVLAAARVSHSFFPACARLLVREEEAVAVQAGAQGQGAKVVDGRDHREDALDCLGARMGGGLKQCLAQEHRPKCLVSPVGFERNHAKKGAIKEDKPE